MLRESGIDVDFDDLLFFLAVEGDAKICSAVFSSVSASCRAERASKAFLIASALGEAEREGGMAAPEGWK